MLNWEQGVHFQIVAFQAVTATLLGGDTIHHACGIPVFGRQAGSEDPHQRQMEVARRTLKWRWLIIAEISMVSARLLADMDCRLRHVIRALGTGTVGRDGHARPFGGLNVLMAGDFLQQDPPEGGFLAALPVEYIEVACQYKAAPTIAHGQGLLWSGPQHGLAGGYRAYSMRAGTRRSMAPGNARGCSRRALVRGQP